MEQAGAKPLPTLFIRLDVQRTGAELEDALEYVNRGTEARGVRERPVKPHAFSPRRASDLDPRELFARPDLQVREGLVVLEALVELRSQVLDHAGLDEHRGDLVFGLDVVDLDDEPDPVADAQIVGRVLVPIAGGPAAEVLGLADVHDPALGILHEVDAGAGGKGPGFFRGKERRGGRRIVGHMGAFYAVGPVAGFFISTPR